MSTQKISNIPNGFERLPKDLNAANLRIELKKLRASAKEGLADEDGTGAAADGKPPSTAVSKAAEEKKGGKADPKAKADPKKPGGKGAAAAQEEEKKDEDLEDDNIIASKKELDLIQHIYVNMLL